MPTTVRRKEKPSPEARLLGLAAFILSQPEPVSRARIYEAFPDAYDARRPAAAEKKFSRDKDALRRLGYHVVVEDETYAIDPRACTLPPIELTADEAAAVWTAGAAALRFAAHPLHEELESALRKLLVGAKGLPPRAAAELLDAPARPPSEARLEKLVDAWERQKRITIDYLRVETGEVTRREVDVYGWAHRRGEWIFVGHCHLRNAVRIFYLSRVRTLKVNARALPGRTSRGGDYDIPDDFDVRRWSRQEVWDYDVHPPRRAAVRLRGSLARIARPLLPAAQVSADGDARVARLEVRNLRGLVRQALAWGPEAEVIEPEDGRAIAREILASLAPGRTP